MSTAPHDTAQDLISRNAGLKLAVQRLLETVQLTEEKRARRKIEMLRNRVVRDLKESGIDPEYEMEHARLVGPAVEGVESIFNDFLDQLDD